MEKVKELIQRAESSFPEEFKRMIPCWASKDHEWKIAYGVNSTMVTFLDIECCHCKMNLASVLKFFVGAQDHG